LSGLKHIASEAQVWVRAAAAVDYSGVWQVRLVEITSGEAAPSWQSRNWINPEAIFSGFVSDGQVLAGRSRRARSTWLAVNSDCLSGK
jgi:hypothetical protein